MANDQLTTFGTFAIPAEVSDRIYVWSYYTQERKLVWGTYTEGEYPLQSVFSLDYGIENDELCATICTIDAPFVTLAGEIYQAQRTLLTSEAAYAVREAGGNFSTQYEALIGTITLQKEYKVVWIPSRGYVFKRKD